MKRIVALILAITCLMTVCVTASAATFTLNVQSENETDLTYRNVYDVMCTTAGRVYVKHSVTGGSSAYTNLFHATKPTNWLVGQKWIAPNSKIPIQSNLLYEESYYGLAARGNTKHYIYDGVSSITLHITYTGD